MENQQYRILVVDDNTKNVQLIASLLSEKGYDVDYALNGSGALEMVNSEHFDLILLDIMMPEMDGFEVCEKLKQDENNKEVPVIFLTAKTDIESIKKAFKNGGQDYVSKPFNAEELLSRVKTHVQLKVSQDKLRDVNEWLDKEVKKKTEELNIANRKLLELDNAKSQFLKIISHEIRTPLNGIMGGISLLKSNELSEKSMTFIKMLDISTARLLDFSYKALDISQFNMHGKKVIRPEKSSITKIITKVLKDKEVEFKTKEINHIHSISSDIILNLDHKYFYKCIFNILENAIKFSPEKGEISLSVEVQNNNVIIEIKDQGPGFEKGFIIDDIGIFESGKHIDKNPGLGLYLSNQIVKAHGGVIENGNNEDKGALVKIVLPVNQ